MTPRIFAAAAAVAFLAFGQQPAAADSYGAPWCAVLAEGDGDMQWHCEYRSIEECRPNVLAGNRGWCNPNPYMADSFQPAGTKHSRKHRARAQ